MAAMAVVIKKMVFHMKWFYSASVLQVIKVTWIGFNYKVIVF